MDLYDQKKRGRVIEVRKNGFIVDSEGQEFAATLRGSFYKETADKWPVVGDFVTFVGDPAGGSVIQSVEERKSFLQRRDTAKPGASQYMAANVDYCFIVTGLDEDFGYNRIARYARYAGIALQGGAVPVVILTKADLCADAEKYIREAQTVSDSLRVHAVSALQGTGMEDLKEYFVPGKTICLMGSSGAGKSTLINALAGEEIMKTGEVRQSDAAGRHTTTHRQLIMLKNGVSVIDTPGMRQIDAALTLDGIDRAFSDIIELENRCRFRNCRHGAEPGCAVRAAVESGGLSAERVRLYQRLAASSAGRRAKTKEPAKPANASQKLKKWKRSYPGE